MKKQVNMDFSPEAYDVLTELSVKLNTTKADVLRRAISITDFLLTEKKKGYSIQLEKGDRIRTIARI